MKSCNYETRVAEAARTGRWNDEVRDHCAACSECAETAMVTAALFADAEMLAVDEAALPDPRAIWLRSRFEDRRSRAIRATRVITWMQRAALLLAACGAAAGVPVLLRLFARPIGDISLSGLVPDLPMSIAAPAVIVLLTFGVMALMAVWNELVESG